MTLIAELALTMFTVCGSPVFVNLEWQGIQHTFWVIKWQHHEPTDEYALILDGGYKGKEIYTKAMKELQEKGIEPDKQEIVGACTEIPQT
jgi:hypothetical protein